MRTKGSKDLKPRSRRTVKEMTNEKINMIREQTEKIKDEAIKEILDENYLVPKELLDLTGCSYERFISNLKNAAELRVKEVLSKYE